MQATRQTGRNWSGNNAMIKKKSAGRFSPTFRRTRIAAVSPACCRQGLAVGSTDRGGVGRERRSLGVHDE